MALLDEVTGITVAVVVVEPVIAGHIEGISYFYQGLAGWVKLDPASPPQMVQGAALSLAVNWVNDGNVPCRGHVDLVITRPDGSEVSPEAVGNQDTVLAPGYATAVEFASITLDQLGSYLAGVELSGEEA